MKKYWIIVLCLTLLAGIPIYMTACDGAAAPNPAEDGCTVVVCTNYAALDFTRSLVDSYTDQGGEGMIEIYSLGKPGQDMHSYEPTAADIVTLSRADLVVCTGAEGWLEKALSASGNTMSKRVAMMEVCDTLEGDHDHDHDHGSEDACGLINGDEHVWLSVGNAKRIVSAIRDELTRSDGENQEVWTVCAELYLQELTTLEQAYADMMATASRRNVVLADRHPFVYLFEELGIECVAAFPGCSSETSATFDTQAMLIEYTREWAVPYVFVIEDSDGKVAEVVASETGVGVLTLNSMQVVTDYENTTYLGVMRQNLENLKKALQ